VREAHILTDVPPWRPAIRFSMAYATATLADAKVATVVDLPRQLELEIAA
jgi:hypothetical protein